MFSPKIVRPVSLLVSTACIILLRGDPRLFAQTVPNSNLREFAGQSTHGEVGVRKTNAEIMARSSNEPRRNIYLKRELEIPGRENRQQDKDAAASSRWPTHSAARVSTATPEVSTGPLFSQTVSTVFDGVSGPSQTGSFPPDSMGAVGPTQFVIFLNGRLRSFNKSTGFADGVLNSDPDIFFSSVMTPTSSGFNFTTDPQIRYDRLSGRWILVMIDVPSSSSNNVGDLPNRIVIAVSDAASGGVISANTVWTHYFIQQNTVGGGSTGEFLDYESLGVDNNALYIGGNMFRASTGAFVTTTGFVVQKSSILNGGPIFVTAFRNLIASGDGPDSPRGVDNFDPAATEGYFIGDSDAAYGRLIIRRVSNPGSTAPSMSSNISVTVNATFHPNPVDHLGNNGGSNGRVDALDTRLFAAHIRNGRLWTAHTIGVNSSGVATNTDRNAVRWYELNVPAGAGFASVVQSGTIFDSVFSSSSARSYWMGSIAVSGQGHSAAGFSTAGTPFHIDAATSGRLAGDALGTISAPTLFTSSTSSYNPSGDQGGSSGRRWGDYSFTSVDPSDDMTMWTIQQFCDGNNSYGLAVAKLIAPAPATPTSASATVPAGQSSVSVTITGSSISGSGFFDPGTGFSKRISGSVTGGIVVNSVTYIDPTHITLNLNTTSASGGAQTVTITNPDGQARSGAGILSVGSGTPTPTPTVTPTPTPTVTPTPTPTPSTPTPTPAPTATPLTTVSAPIITPNGGSFRRRAEVQMSCATSGALIRYTLNGTTPTETSLAFTREFRVTSSTVIKARAFKAGSNPSAVTTATFSITRRR